MFSNPVASSRERAFVKRLLFYQPPFPNSTIRSHSFSEPLLSLRMRPRLAQAAAGCDASIRPLSEGQRTLLDEVANPASTPRSHSITPHSANRRCGPWHVRKRVERIPSDIIGLGFVLPICSLPRRLSLGPD